MSDLLKTAKDFIVDYKKHAVERQIIEGLIEEVERLLEEIADYMSAKQVSKDAFDKIESLESQLAAVAKERDRAVRQNKLYTLATTSGQEWEIGERIEKLEAENSDYKDSFDKMKGIASGLQEENAAYKEDVALLESRLATLLKENAKLKVREEK